MDQPTFAYLEYQGKKRKTRREVFMERMDGLIPWQLLEDRIRLFYPKAGRGRHPYPLSTMLRTHCVQLFYNLRDPGMEDLLYESKPVRRSVGLKLREGTIVDAIIIEAPSSTKNRTGQRDPEMRQVKKGNQYHFGMKLHIGVDAKTGLVHSLSATSANVHDVTEAHRLLHGGEHRVWGDAGYIGVQKREENPGLAVDWQVAMKPGQRRKLEPDSAAALREKVKASIRAKVEHPFLDVKGLFGYAKVRYRGLAKNRERLALLGLSNLRRAQALLAR